jgi:hypothetical protein
MFDENPTLLSTTSPRHHGRHEPYPGISPTIAITSSSSPTAGGGNGDNDNTSTQNDSMFVSMAIEREPQATYFWT